MNATEELEERCALTRSRKLGGLTPAGFEELRRDVHENLSDFIETDDQRALNILKGALARYNDSVKDDDLRGDDEFMAERKKRLSALVAAAQQAQGEDPPASMLRLSRPLPATSIPKRSSMRFCA